MRNEIITLKNESYGMVPIGIPVPVFILFGRGSVDNKVTFIITVQASDNVQQGRFSGTGRSQDSDKFIVAKIQADIIQCFLQEISCFIFFSDISNLKHLFHSTFKCFQIILHQFQVSDLAFKVLFGHIMAGMDHRRGNAGRFGNHIGYLMIRHFNVVNCIDG